MAQPAKGFLDLIQQKYDGHYDGDEYGGAAGQDGSGLPTGAGGDFMFATGIECSYPTIDHGRVRRDQLEECGHYARYREDLGLIKELGLKVVRYGLPYYSIHKGPGRFDWSFADEAMGEIRRLGLTPILDLMHFGVPDWVGNYQNPELPLHFSEYADAVAERYPWVRYYTPVNELYVTARASARDGIWNEQCRDDRSFVTALKHAVAASILGTQRIARRRPDCVLIQSESAEYVHEMCASPSPSVALTNQLRLTALDLLYGRPPSGEVCLFLMDNGLTRAEYDWFMAGEPPGYQVMGSDYYGRNERLITPGGGTCPAEGVLGWFQIVHEFYTRYHKPVMHTETNTFDADEAPGWLWKQWANVLRMRALGVPVLGFTWYSLIDQVDWDVSLAEKRGVVNACGLYDLDRKPRPVAKAYRALLEEFGRITTMPHGELFEITSRPARLKVEV